LPKQWQGTHYGSTSTASCTIFLGQVTCFRKPKMWGRASHWKENDGKID